MSIKLGDSTKDAYKLWHVDAAGDRNAVGRAWWVDDALAMHLIFIGRLPPGTYVSMAYNPHFDEFLVLDSAAQVIRALDATTLLHVPEHDIARAVWGSARTASQLSYGVLVAGTRGESSEVYGLAVATDLGQAEIRIDSASYGTLANTRNPTSTFYADYGAWGYWSNTDRESQARARNLAPTVSGVRMVGLIGRGARRPQYENSAILDMAQFELRNLFFLGDTDTKTAFAYSLGGTARPILNQDLSSLVVADSISGLERMGFGDDDGNHDKLFVVDGNQVREHSLVLTNQHPFQPTRPADAGGPGAVTNLAATRDATANRVVATWTPAAGTTYVEVEWSSAFNSGRFIDSTRRAFTFTATSSSNQAFTSGPTTPTAGNPRLVWLSPANLIPENRNRLRFSILTSDLGGKTVRAFHAGGFTEYVPASRTVSGAVTTFTVYISNFVFSLRAVMNIVFTDGTLLYPNSSPGAGVSRAGWGDWQFVVTPFNANGRGPRSVITPTFTPDPNVTSPSTANDVTPSLVAGSYTVNTGAVYRTVTRTRSETVCVAQRITTAPEWRAAAFDYAVVFDVGPNPLGVRAGSTVLIKYRRVFGLTSRPPARLDHPTGTTIPPTSPGGVAMGQFFAYVIDEAASIRAGRQRTLLYGENQLVQVTFNVSWRVYRNIDSIRQGATICTRESTRTVSYEAQELVSAGATGATVTIGAERAGNAFAIMNDGTNLLAAVDTPRDQFQDIIGYQPSNARGDLWTLHEAVDQPTGIDMVRVARQGTTTDNLYFLDGSRIMLATKSSSVANFGIPTRFRSFGLSPEAGSTFGASRGILAWTVPSQFALVVRGLIPTHSSSGTNTSELNPDNSDPIDITIDYSDFRAPIIYVLDRSGRVYAYQYLNPFRSVDNPGTPVFRDDLSFFYHRASGETRTPVSHTLVGGSFRVLYSDGVVRTQRKVE